MLNDGGCEVAVVVGVPPPPLPLLSTLFIAAIFFAATAPAKAACTTGYAGKKVVIGDFCAVVYAFCTPCTPLIVALAIANALPTLLSLPAN